MDDIVKDLSFNVNFYRIVTLTRNSIFLLHQYNLTRDQSTKLMKEEENGQIIVIHLPISYKKVNLEPFHPMTFKHQNTINIIESSTTDETPLLQDENIVIQEDDYYNPLFVKMVFEKINSIICGMN